MIKYTSSQLQAWGTSELIEHIIMLQEQIND